MSAEDSKPTKDIEQAFTSISNLQGIRTLEGLRWYENVNLWVIKCRITIGSPNKELIPNETDWYIWLETAYPRGKVELLPAKENGITKTFQHQYYNSQGEIDVPWRNGLICARTGMFWFRRSDYDIEPFEPENRLKWYMEQMLEWLSRAAAGNLVKEGEVFELPDYNTSQKPCTIAFCESPETFRVWRSLNHVGTTGIVELGLLRYPINTYVATSFKDHNGNPLYQPPWSEYFKGIAGRKEIGAWALVPGTVVLPPWQAPMTWDELAKTMESQGVDYIKMLGRLSKNLRDGQPHFVLVGFPMPDKIGQPSKHIHWQALNMPILSWGKGHAGYQNKSRSLLRRDLDIILRKYKELDWQKSENWHSSEILNRGRYSSQIIDSKILIIGIGALGSMIAEMLVRGGANNIILIDHDKIEIGNLTRDTLTLDDIGRYKTDALQERLVKISPYVKARTITSKFESVNANEANKIDDAKIVIDCTGNDDVLYCLKECSWSKSPIFFSVSISLQAKRFYILVSRKSVFPIGFFQRHISKWLSKDIEEYDGDELPRSGGIGCWHPAFPARGDEMWLWAATALKYLVIYTQSEAKYSKLAVFEQRQSNSSFDGVRLVEECDDS